MITYQKKVSPLYECIYFIDAYYHQELHYDKALKSFVNDEEYKMIQKLEEMGKAIGSIAVSECSEAAFLFTYIFKEKTLSGIKHILFEFCDFLEPDYHKQIEQMRTYHASHPNQVLLSILSEAKDEELKDDLSIEDLMSMLEALQLEDEIKWNVLRLQRRIHEVLDLLEQLMDKVYPVYLSYQETINAFEAYFDQEMQQEYEQGDLYHFVIDSIGFKFQGEDGVLFVPTAAGCRSVSLMFQTHTHKKILVVLYGVGSSQKLNTKQLISDEELCNTLKLLADKSKFDVLCYIAKQKAYGAQIANELKLTTPTISYHMQSLLNAQLISLDQVGNRLYYYLNTDYLREFLKQVEERILQ